METWLIILIGVAVISCFIFVFSLCKVASQGSRQDEEKEAKKAEEEKSI